ncbi:MAG: hypothetical protein ACFE75_05470 [Candidatus Hodarchaeota archaeon]
MLKKIFKKRISEIREKYKNKNVLIIDETSNFFGLESQGIWKVRGNGVLLLTEEELFFGMWKPKKEFLIPVKSIIEISNPRSYMHRSVFRPLLKITFKNEKRESDSAAWYVRNLDKWNEVINELIS